MNKLQRRLLISALCALSSATVLPVRAQATYPTKAVTITTAFAAGSGPDAVLRQVSDSGFRLTFNAGIGAGAAGMPRLAR